MKVNFKYAILVCAALLTGLTSCSDNNEDNGGVEDAPKAFAKITLIQNDGGNTRAAVPETAATEAESKIFNAKLYVFSSVKALEQIIDINPATPGTSCEKVFETSQGSKYFIVAANIPDEMQAFYFPVGTAMADVNKVISTIDATKFATYHDATKGFYMTTGVHDDHDRIDSESKMINPAPTEAEAAAANPIEVLVGRAFGKFKFTVADDVTTPDLNVLFEVDGYRLINNPDRMNYMPEFSGAMFQTPDYFAYDKINVPTAYWPSVHADGDKAGFYNAKATFGTPEYIMENSNSLPTYGNATIVAIQAKYFDKRDASWHSGSAPAVSYPTYWRIFNTATEKFEDKFFASEAEVGAFIGAATNYQPVKYTNSVCYYLVPLKTTVPGRQISKPELYNIYRNYYYDMVITGVEGCGYNEPDGGDYPGTTEPKDPLDPEENFIKVKIQAAPWKYVQANTVIPGV